MKNMPYIVPEGYFDRLEDRVRPWERPARRPVKKAVPYIAAAAVAAVIATGISLMPSGQTESYYPDIEAVYMEYLYSDLIPATDPELLFYDEGYTDSRSEASDAYTVGDDELVDYLIESGATIEEARQIFLTDTLEY